MRRCGLILLGVLIMLSSSGMAAAFQNEPAGFRGIDWGADINTLKANGMSFSLVSEQGGMKNYIRKDDSLVMGEAELQDVTYSFYNDRFFRALIDYQNIWNYEDLETLLTNAYGLGRPAPNRYKTLWWNGEKVSIGLAYGIMSRSGTLSLIYLPIQFERERDEVESISRGTSMNEKTPEQPLASVIRAMN